MPGITLTIDPVHITVDHREDGTFVAIGESLPMLICGIGDDAVAHERINAAMREFIGYVVRSGPERTAKYLSARDINFRIDVDGRRIARESFTMPELAVGAP